MVSSRYHLTPSQGIKIEISLKNKKLLQQQTSNQVLIQIAIGHGEAHVLSSILGIAILHHSLGN